MEEDDVDLSVVPDELGARLPIKKLLLEGGAKMNGAFLKAGLVDEISLLLRPAIDGKTGASPSTKRAPMTSAPSGRLPWSRRSRVRTALSTCATASAAERSLIRETYARRLSWMKTKYESALTVVGFIGERG